MVIFTHRCSVNVVDCCRTQPSASDLLNGKVQWYNSYNREDPLEKQGLGLGLKVS
jgi:hypothetical protein